MQANSRRDEGEHQGGTGGVVGRLAGQDEDAGADDGAHPEAGELHGAEDAAQAPESAFATLFQTK